MHQFIVNAAIQILPVVQDRHPYEWVDEAIEVIQASGLKYEVGPFETVIEGRYKEVMNVIDAINEKLFSRGCAEWICHTQVQIRSYTDITADEKIGKFQ